MTATFISVEDARAAILSDLPAPLPERVPAHLAPGRVLFADVRTRHPVPEHSSSSRDGYAVRAADLSADAPITLRVTSTIHAGHQPDTPVGPGEAARIMTGALIPEGADTIVMQEDCARDGDQVTIPSPRAHHAGQWVRATGSFVEANTPLLRAGQRLDAGALGALLSIGISHVTVARRPRVAIVSTGDELREPGEPLGPGLILNSNGPMLAALLAPYADPLLLPIAPDDPQAVRDAYAQAIAAADVVISSGGVSVGERDHVRETIEALCQGVTFWKIRMKPGKPLAFGRAHGPRAVPLLGLPGNPASSLVCFYQFVRPALRLMLGQPLAEVLPKRERATLTADLPSTPKRREYATGTLAHDAEGGLLFTPIPNQDSGNPAILCGVQALGVVDEGVGALRAGDPIEIERL